MPDSHRPIAVAAPRPPVSVGSMNPATWHAERAIVGGAVVADVAITVEGGSITGVAGQVPPPDGARRLGGLTIPGLVNAHSHAFHRAMRGWVERRGADFWGWRAAMYAVASRLDPDSYRDLATAVYCEMALSGITAVGEFHYLHHGPRGARYAEPNAMADALRAAADTAGIRLTLLDACYLRGGWGVEADEIQQRFSDGSVDAWEERVSLHAGSDRVKVGAAIHSVRAVDEAGLARVAEWATSRRAPLHFHVSEQRAENEAALAATGRTPIELLAEGGALGRRSTAIHATHVTGGDVGLLGGTGTGVCMCPTTERALGDGVGPAAALAAAGSPLSVGSDSHAVIDLFEEARAIELDERLSHERRRLHTADDLLQAATAGGMASLGWEGGAIREGAPADFVALDVEGSIRLAGAADSDLVDHVVFAAAPSDVTEVVVGGRPVVSAGRHVAGDVAAMLARAISRVRR